MLCALAHVDNNGSLMAALPSVDSRRNHHYARLSNTTKAPVCPFPRRGSVRWQTYGADCSRLVRVGDAGGGDTAASI